MCACMNISLIMFKELGGYAICEETCGHTYTSSRHSNDNHARWKISQFKGWFSRLPGRETSMNGHTEFETKSTCNLTLASMFEIDTMGHEKDITLIISCKRQPNLSRRDSFEDLMLHLRKIGSLLNIVNLFTFKQNTNTSNLPWSTVWVM